MSKRVRTIHHGNSILSTSYTDNEGKNYHHIKCIETRFVHKSVLEIRAKNQSGLTNKH